MPAEPNKSLWRNVGEFFGHIVHAVKHQPGATGSLPSPMQPQVSTTPPTPPADGTVRRTVTQEVHQSPDGPVVLRRTTVEEVRLPPSNPPTGPGPSSPPPG